MAAQIRAAAMLPTSISFGAPSLFRTRLPAVSYSHVVTVSFEIPSLHTVPQRPAWNTSARPSSGQTPSVRRNSPSSPGSSAASGGISTGRPLGARNEGVATVTLRSRGWTGFSATSRMSSMVRPANNPVGQRDKLVGACHQDLQLRQAGEHPGGERGDQVLEQVQLLQIRQIGERPVGQRADLVPAEDERLQLRQAGEHPGGKRGKQVAAQVERLQLRQAGEQPRRETR